MKKSIFILAALIAATLVNAQITLEHTINAGIYPPQSFGIDEEVLVLGDIFATYLTNDNAPTRIYDANDYSLLATLPYRMSSYYDGCIIARNYFTTDNRIMYAARKWMNDYYQFGLYDQTGAMIQNLGTSERGFFNLFLLNGEYKLLIRKYSSSNYDATVRTEIYSLPGNGSAQAVSSPVSPKHAARKIARDKQVLVETEDNTYTLTGQEIK